MGRILICGTLFLTLSSVAAAQHHGGSVAGRAPVMTVAPRTAAPMAHAAVAAHPLARVAPAPGAAQPTSAIRHVNLNGGVSNRRVSVASGLRNLPLFPTEANDVPGLGFDFPHFAAINQNRRHRHFFDQGFGLGFSGFLLSPSVIVTEPQPVEGQPPVEETAAASAHATDGDRDFSDQFLPSAGAPAALPADAPEFVFVRRDGSLLFAVGYSWDNGTLRYVTKDGLRRSVTQDMLDMNATQQFNEQRGLSFHVPA